MTAYRPRLECPTRLTAQDIERLVAAHFDHRANLIVPNVSWGWGLAYEADMVVVRPSGYAMEIEIKQSHVPAVS